MGVHPSGSPGETVLVTGASSGIGRELAFCFARDGADCVLLARTESKLRELASTLDAKFGINTHVLQADLSTSSVVDDIQTELQRRDLSVDVLVNNAGFGVRGDFVDLDRRRQLDMIRVNVTALTNLTRRLLPRMIERGRGGVLNVASTAAFQPGPKMSVYYASKAYVLSFSEALYEEVKQTGVTVTCLAPGPTRTSFVDEAKMDETRLFQWGIQMSPEAVAQRGHGAFRAGRVVTVPGWANKLAAFMTRFTPRPIARKLVHWLNTS